ncbi:MAG: hypothetical protein GY804_03980 [Alphaproteobacteria bacterium]|nr:hypothetical protein [Alphaproteobacteria bacterium]
MDNRDSVMLYKAQHWIEKTFAQGHGPTVKTVCNWIRTGKIHGLLINGSAWIDPENFIIKEDEVITEPIVKYEII